MWVTNWSAISENEAVLSFNESLFSQLHTTRRSVIFHIYQSILKKDKPGWKISYLKKDFERFVFYRSEQLTSDAKHKKSQ